MRRIYYILMGERVMQALRVCLISFPCLRGSLGHIHAFSGYISKFIYSPYISIYAYECIYIYIVIIRLMFLLSNEEWLY